MTAGESWPTLPALVRREAERPGVNLRDALERIHSMDAGPEGVGAFLSVAEEPRVPSRPRTGALAGVPVAVKDNLCTTDFDTTCGSRILEGYRSPYDATVVRRLREAGAVVIGKTNMDEFAMGSSTENSAFGSTRNPRDLERVPGGSSGGSAAAVAAGMVPVALGSDTGGSVRQPAALCGVVGIKPTYGRVSRYGLIAFASSFDQVGSFGMRVEDAALLLQVVAGPDPFDATCSARPVPDLIGAVREGARDGPRGLRIGIPRELPREGVDQGVAERLATLEAELTRAGAKLRAVDLPSSAAAIAAYYLLAPAEASSNLSRYDGVRYGLRAEGADDLDAMYTNTRGRGFGQEVRRRILVGTFALSAGYYDSYYGRAQRTREAVRSDFERAFTEVDLLLTPTAPTPAFRLGERLADPIAMYASDLFTVTANLAGLPAVSVPIGDVDGLPVGGQLIAPAWHEAPMLRAASALEALLRGGGAW